MWLALKPLISRKVASIAFTMAPVNSWTKRKKTRTFQCPRHTAAIRRGTATETSAQRGLRRKIGPKNGACSLDKVVRSSREILRFLNNLDEPLQEDEFPGGGTGETIPASLKSNEFQELVELDNKPFKSKGTPGGYSNEPEVEYGCGRTASTNPAEWALLGVAEGLEEWEAGEAKEVLRPMAVETVFEPVPIGISAEKATEVTENHATLTGTITPNGYPTKYVIEYSEQEYGVEHTTPETLVSGSGTTSVPVSMPLMGLAYGTTYYYRVKAFHYGNENNVDTTLGPEESFTTPTPPPLQQCAGSNIEAAGSSLQAEAQDLWNTTFNTPTATPAPKTSCNGENGSKGKPKVKYNSTSSGKGIAAWNEGTNFGKLGFIGTDSPPNPEEVRALEEKHKKRIGRSAKVLTIPVLQGAVAVIINLPEGCLGESTAAKHRLTLNQSTLEGIFAGTISEWSQIADDGDKIVQDTAKGSPTCNAKSPIKTVVREDASGTTHIFKRFLYWSNDGAMTTPSGKFTWDQLSEIEKSTTWPTGVGAIKGNQGEGEVRAVAATPGSIGYANLADARNPAYGSIFAPGESEQRFWAEIESEPGVYADPSTNKDVEKRASANCKSTEYMNGEKSFPPPSVESTWNEVGTEQYSKSYAICGLTYDLVLSHYSTFENATQAEAATVHDYESYILDSKGGQAEIDNDDYLPLTSAVLTKSLEGLPLITW
jgi:ABC-type phosphate transport system substrate-binding protein